MPGRHRPDDVPAVVGEHGELAPAVVGGPFAAHPAAVLQARHRVREPALRLVRPPGQVAHPAAAAGRLRQHRQHDVGGVADPGIALQLGVQGPRQQLGDRQPGPPGPLLLVVEPPLRHGPTVLRVTSASRAAPGPGMAAAAAGQDELPGTGRSELSRGRGALPVAGSTGPAGEVSPVPDDPHAHRSSPGTRPQRPRPSGRSGAPRSGGPARSARSSRRTGSFSSANTRRWPRASSRLVQVDEDVGGGGVHVGDRLGGDHDPVRGRLGAGQPQDLVAERLGVGEEQRRVEPVDDQAGQLPRVRVGAHVVVAGAVPRPGPSVGPVGPPRTAEDVEDRQPHGDPDAGQHAEQGDAGKAAIDRQNSSCRCCHSRAVPGMSASDSDAVMTTAASVGWGRFRNRPGSSTIISDDQRGADDAGELGPRARPLGHRGAGARWC